MSRKSEKAYLEPRRRVFVAMSGGVDSSVAAALLKEQNYDVTGVHIRCFNVDGCGKKDAEDARRVAEQLNIPFYVFDLEKEYKEKVVQYMVDGYRQGITPNPDIMCNKEIKFGLFLKRALKLGADYVATGHYIKIQKSKIKNQNDNAKLKIIYRLHSARDKNKDQSYFLWTLNQDQLKHCLFPIGDYTKPQVRKLAKKFGLLTAEKKDSQGICFLGKISLTQFMESYLPKRRGAVLGLTGEKIGEHQGAHFYTIGQRHGFQIKKSKIKNQNDNAKLKNNYIKPHYIVNKNIKDNSLVVAEGEKNLALYKKEILLKNVNFVNPLISNTKYLMSVLARVRYHQPLAKATLHVSPASFGKIRMRLVFDSPQKFIAPGQSAVFYSTKGELLGGGVIC